ncbi:pmt-2 [Pristionchus pacificus]|uniref:phosphoethanolamine N-methyltransferase n=1 Tax=Pristionchus pacificus TaxID=54126 RepID=A0A454XWE5_PRIPA|nr:pmt-2 [Pristionchus pacificus]|eukprot:PDM70495.1 pmt-2 [Pristionchus pacificus]
MSATERQILRLANAAAPAGFKQVAILPRTSSLKFSGLLSSSTHSEVTSLDSVSNADLIVVDKVLVSDGLVTKDGLQGGPLDSFLLSALTALNTGGVLVVREDLSQHANPRVTLPSLTDYVDVFRRDISGKYVGFDFYCAEQLDSSIHLTGNYLDFVWILRKKEFTPPAADAATVTFRDFLDKTQYTNTGIGAYEWMFGKDFISPGGYDENIRVLEQFGGFEYGAKMLDIGSGIGGGVRQAAAVYGLQVTGVDLSANMLSEAIVRIHDEKDSRVNYSICDAVTYDFGENVYDYIFSRDCIQHIPDQDALFKNIYKSLKPGGVVLITMYGKGKGAWTEAFKKYNDQRFYHLQTLDEVKERALKHGFEAVHVENMTERFREILTNERAHLEKEKADFFKNYTQAEFDSLYNGWSAKLKYIEADNHNWNLFRARKPAH